MSTSKKSDDQVKADAIEAARRVSIIKGFILEGATPANIVDDCKLEWGIGRAQVYRYMSRARAEIAAESEALGTVSLEWHLAARCHLYNQCMKVNDFGNARQTLKDLGDLQGLYKNKGKGKPKPGKPAATMDAERFNALLEEGFSESDARAMIQAARSMPIQ